jgi:hypothetical protein
MTCYFYNGDGTVKGSSITQDVPVTVDLGAGCNTILLGVK